MTVRKVVEGDTVTIGVNFSNTKPGKYYTVRISVEHPDGVVTTDVRVYKVLRRLVRK